MTTILIWAGLSSLAFTVFFALTIVSILQKRAGLVAAAVGAFVVAMGSGIGAVILAHSEDLTTTERAPGVRNGTDIYQDLFGRPEVHCVTISHHRPFIAPAFGRSECVRAYVCPDEVRRITRQHHRAWQRTASFRAQRPPDGTVSLGDFAPEALGDTILVHEDQRAQRWLYCSEDSAALIAVTLIH
jgi:hypothetical protein